MIDSLEANIGDCCWFLLKDFRSPKYGTIIQVIKNESAVQVMEAVDSKFHIVWEKNAAWDEKELKGQKWEKPHNYLRDIPEDPNEEESDERERDVHHGKKTEPKGKRAKARGSIVPKGARRKQGSVRGTKRPKNNTKRGRTTRRKQK